MIAIDWLITTPSILQRRHQALRIGGQVVGLQMLAAAARQVPGHRLVGHPFPVERDADSECRGAAVIAVELHGEAQLATAGP